MVRRDDTHVSSDSTIATVSAFYRDVLRGREVRATRAAGRRNRFCFIVGETPVEVRSAVRTPPAPIVVDVDDPAEIAERCWDAGFRVRVREVAAGRALQLSVVDPLGRQIDLNRRRRLVKR